MHRAIERLQIRNFTRSNLVARSAAILLLAVAQVPGAAAAAADDPPGASIESLLELARASNPEFASMRFEADAASERLGSAGAFPDPSLRVELMDITNSGTTSPSLRPSRIGEAKYTFMQMLPWFGKRDAMRGAAEADARAAASRAQGGWLEITTRIKTAYAQYYLAYANERLVREMLDLLARLETVAQSRYAGGLAAQQDAIRAQVEITTLRTDLIVIEAERHRVSARINALVGRPIVARLAEPRRARPIPPPARMQLADLQERIVARNPIVAAEAARVESATKTLDGTYLSRYPDVTVGVAPTQMGNKIMEWEVMFEVSIPLQQGARRAREREAHAMLGAAKARHDAAANTAAGELGEAVAGLEAARRTDSVISASLLPQAELTFQSALAAYENGKVDFATLLDAQRQVLRARQEGLKAQAEAQARLAEIERIVGEDL